MDCGGEQHALGEQKASRGDKLGLARVLPKQPKSFAMLRAHAWPHQLSDGHGGTGKSNPIFKSSRWAARGKSAARMAINA
jgi:hypothetical protein